MTLLLILGLIVSIIGFIVMRPDDYDGNNPGGVDRVPWKDRKPLRKEWEKRGLDYQDYYKTKAKLEEAERLLDEINESHKRG